jgi:hypothetical protein
METISRPVGTFGAADTAFSLGGVKPLMRRPALFFATSFTLLISSCCLSTKRELEESFVTKSRAPLPRASIVISAWSHVNAHKMMTGRGLVDLIRFNASIPSISGISTSRGDHIGLQLLDLFR